MNDLDSLVYEYHIAGELGTKISPIQKIHTFSDGSILANYILDIFGKDDRTEWCRRFVPQGNGYRSTGDYDVLNFNIKDNYAQLEKAREAFLNNFIDRMTKSIHSKTQV